ncbi:MAG: Ser/Thr protein kinase, partial [Desulfuromusa sp.]|nr:Ser/Thr protein kinase [Desulfuromusa sp.]
MFFAAKNLFIIVLLLIVSTSVYAAPKAELWPRWQANNAQSSLRVDHSIWALFLDKYLVVGKFGAANLVRYADVSSADKDSLAQYLAELSAVPMSKLNRAEQKSTWINLYNALTVQT